MTSTKAPNRRRRLFVGATLGALGVAWWLGADPLATRLARQATSSLFADGWSLSPVDVELSLVSGSLEVTKAVLTSPDGHEEVAFDELSADIEWTGLLSGQVVVSELVLRGAVIDLTETETGLQILNAFPPGEPKEDKEDSGPYEGLPVTVRVDSLILEAPTFRLGPEEGAPSVDLNATLRASVELPRGRPEVIIRDLSLVSDLAAPLNDEVRVQGEASWTPERVTFRQLSAQAFGSDLKVDGALGLSATDGDLKVTIDALDLDRVDELSGAGTAGRYFGSLQVTGGLEALSIEGELTGEEGSNGTLSLRPDTVVCLTGPGLPCGGTPLPVVNGNSSSLRWKANLGFEGFALEGVLPVVGGPLLLNGSLGARGGGTAWPEGVVIEDGDLQGRDLDVFGLPIHEVSSRLGLYEGRFVFETLGVTGIAGSLDGSGSLDLNSGSLSVDATGLLQPSMLSDLEVEGLGGEGPMEVSVRGELFEEGVPIDVFGTAQLKGASYGGDIRFSTLNADYKVHYEDGVTQVNTGVRAYGGLAYGAKIPQVRVPDLSVTVADRIEVGGTAIAPTMQYDTLATMEEVVAGFTFESGDVTKVTTTVDLGSHDVATFLGDEGHIELEMVDDVVVMDIDLLRRDEPWVELDALQLTLADQLVVDLQRAMLNPVPRQRWETLEGRPVHLVLADNGLRESDIVLASELGTLEVEGDLDLTGDLNGWVRLKSFQLDALAELYPEQFGDFYGEVTCSGQFKGSGAAPDIRLEVLGEDLFLPGGVQWLGIKGGAHIRPDAVGMDVIFSSVDADVLELAGTVPYSGGLTAPALSTSDAMDLHLSILPGSWSRVADLVDGVEAPEGEVSGDLLLTGAPLDPEIELELVTEVAVSGWRDRGRVELDVSRQAGDLRSDISIYQGYHPMIRVNSSAQTELSEVLAHLFEKGSLPEEFSIRQYANSLEITTIFEEAPLAAILEVLGREEDVGGSLSGTMSLSGEVDQPIIRSDLTLNGIVEGEPLNGRFVYDDAGNLVFLLGDEEAPWLSVTGELPVKTDFTKSFSEWEQQPISLSFGGSGLPLVMVGPFVEDVDITGGMLRLSGQATGQLDDLEPNVVATLEGFSGGLNSMGLSIVDLGANFGVVQLDEDTLKLEMRDVTGRTQPLSVARRRRGEESGRKNLSGGGSVLLTAEGLGDVEANFSLNNAWLSSTDSLALKTTGDIAVTGKYPELEIGGRLRVDQGNVWMNTADLDGATSLEIDPDLRIIRGTAPTDVFAESLELEVPSLADSVTVDMHVDFGRGTTATVLVPVLDALGQVGATVTQAEVKARIGGELDIGMKKGELSILGELKTLDGRVGILNSRFDLNESTIKFYGADYANPVMDIKGVLSVSGGGVNLDLTGTPSSPNLNLSSEDFGSQAELFTILLTGEAPGDLSGDQGQAAAQAMGDMLLQSVLGSMNLGNVSVQADGSVTVGIPVNNSLYVDLLLDPQPGPQENPVTAILEWSILPKLLLSVALGNPQLWGDLFWEYKF